MVIKMLKFYLLSILWLSTVAIYFSSSHMTSISRSGSPLRMNSMNVDWNTFFLPLSTSYSSIEGSPSGASNGFPSVFVALSLYNELHGHTIIDPEWAVPSEFPWPSELWGER
jgi:hypothetical protein